MKCPKCGSKRVIGNEKAESYICVACNSSFINKNGVGKGHKPFTPKATFTMSIRRQEVLEAMKAKYLLNSTILVTIEELSELTQALVKYLRTDEYAVHNVEEEIADVQIMLDQLKLSFDVKLIAEWDDMKIKRIAERYLSTKK